jgi:hypothetical protein
MAEKSHDVTFENDIAILTMHKIEYTPAICAEIGTTLDALANRSPLTKALVISSSDPKVWHMGLNLAWIGANGP